MPRSTKRLRAEIDQDDADLAAIIGIDGPGALATVIPCFAARPSAAGPGPRSPRARRSRDPSEQFGVPAAPVRYPGRWRPADRHRRRRPSHSRAAADPARGAAARSRSRCFRRPSSAPVELLCSLLVARLQRCSAIRPASRMATSLLPSGGQSSTPRAVIRCTVLRSPPKVPVAGDTSLATIQSQPLRVPCRWRWRPRSRSRRRSPPPARAARDRLWQASPGCRDWAPVRAPAAERLPAS